MPLSPGVYLMKTPRGTIIYIGKAKNLKERVRSYFTESKSDNRFITRHVHKLVGDIETIITNTEKEALLLENNLIKTHSPRFNVRLRDDKNYLSLRLDTKARWPRLEIIRRPKKDGAFYFGPYHSASSARETLKLVNKYFKLRSCKDRVMANRTRPCLNYQMHRCFGPCVLDVDEDDYRQQVEYVRLFLSGRRDDLVRELKNRMQKAADEFEYEKAALLRDQIVAVKETLAPQRVVMPGGVDQDVVGLYREGDQIVIAILEIRSGQLKGKVDFYFSGQEFPDFEILSSFIMQRYSDLSALPREIIVSTDLLDKAVLSELLTERSGRKVSVLHPLRGSRAQLAEMAVINARQLLELRIREEDVVQERLQAIQKRLRLTLLPERIECVDISHLGGGDTVGAISVTIRGQIERSLGRTYRVRNVAEGDDFAAMAEVLKRRFRRAMAEEKGWEAPDLLVVDGGRGQLSAALAALKELSVSSQSVVALAKERKGEGETLKTDRIFLPGRMNPIPLKAGISPLQILAAARDEAHRLANGYQRKMRRKKAIGSELDDIPGVGPKLRGMLLRKLGSVKKIRESSLEDLAGIPGVGQKLAQRIRDGLRNHASSSPASSS